MRDGGHEIVPIGHVEPTKDMRLKYIQMQRQKIKSRIASAKQGIEDLKNGKIAELEYQILHAEAELKQLDEHEKRVKSSVDTQQIK